uniref:Uncharacterized protein n=1 Tax=Parascaris univalens TaxID=6257 RepID=A0A915AQH9_PARUN
RIFSVMEQTLEQTHREDRNQPAFDGDRTMNPVQRIANATHQRPADGVYMVGSEPIIHRVQAARLNGGMAPCVAWQRNGVMNFPNWRPEPYTRSELILLKALKGSLFGYIIVSLLNSLATGSDLMVVYLLLPSITGLFTMYALVSEQFVHLIPFLLALSFSILETLATSFVTLQIRFVTRSDYSLLTRFILQRLPDRMKTLTKMVNSFFWSTIAFQFLFLLFYCISYAIVIVAIFMFRRRTTRALQLEADRRARIEQLNQHFLNAAMAADDVVEGLPVADIAFADRSIIGPFNADNPPSYKTAIKSLTKEESPPHYSLFKHDKRFAQFHSNSDSTSPTINHSQSPPSQAVQMIAQPASASASLDTARCTGDESPAN